MGKLLEETQAAPEQSEPQVQEWLAEVDRLLDQAVVWARRREWETKLDHREISEPSLGVYEAPVLLIHSPQGRLLLEPIARDVVGAEGRLEFCVMPSYDSIPLVKIDGAWQFLTGLRYDVRQPWSEATFDQIARELLKRR